MEKFLLNYGKLHFEGLVQLLKYIRDNKNLGLEYYAKIYDEPLSDLFRRASIKTDNELMVLSDWIWQYFRYTDITTGEYILFYQGGPIDHCTYFPGTVGQYIGESEYNVAYTSVMDIGHFSMINNEFLNKYLYMVPETSRQIILDRNSSVCMA